MIRCDETNLLCQKAVSVILQSVDGDKHKFTLCTVGTNNCIFNKITEFYMEKYVARMIEEHAQLVTRIEKLHKFIYDDMGNPKQNLPVSFVDYANMCIQLRGMRMYREALEARLDNAGIWVGLDGYHEKIATVEEVLNHPIPKDNCDCERKPTDEE